MRSCYTSTMLSWFRTRLLPARCLICAGGDEVSEGVCRACRAGIHNLPDPVCDICGTPVGTSGICLRCRVHPPAYDRCLSACRFEGTLREVIHRFKYGHATAYKKFLAGLLYRMIEERDIRADVVVPVPLHWTGIMARGYNQSALIAQELSRYMKTDVQYGILCKARKTPKQVGLSGKDRERNLKRVFRARHASGRTVMVVDDVITTGGTAEEISRTLKDAGAAKVIFVSVGRAVS